MHSKQAKAAETFEAGLVSREDVAELLGERFGLPPSAKLASDAWRLSGGQLEILESLLEAGAADGRINVDEHAVQLVSELELRSDTMRTLTCYRALSQAARVALEELAQVAPLPRALAEKLVGQDRLCELIASGLIRVLPRGGTRPATAWIPTQAIADRLRAEAAEHLRARVHQLVLAEPLRGATPWSALGRARSLIWWYEHAHSPRSVPPTDQPVPILPAVQAANRSHQWELAADLATYALNADSSVRSSLLLERSHARRFLGDVGGAFSDLSTLHEEQRGPGAVEGMADLLHFEYGDTQGAIDLLQSTSAASNLDREQGELRAAQAMHLAYAGRFEECEGVYRTLRPGSMRERGRADVAHAMVMAQQGKTLQALRKLYKLQMTPHSDAPNWYVEELQGALFLCLLMAHGPRRTITATGVLGSREQDPFVRFDEVSVLTARISLLLSQGHSREALRLSLSLDASAEHDRTGLGVHALALGAEAAAYLGDEAQSRYLEDRYRESSMRSSGVLAPNSEASLCAAALLRGDSEAAARTLTVASSLRAAGLGAAALRVAAAGLRVSDPGCAALVVELGAETNGDVCRVFTAHGRAIVERDPHAIKRVAEEYLALGFTLHAAEAFCQVLAIAQETGITALADEATSRARLLLSLAEEIRAPHLVVPGSATVELTRREREIAVLVSQGASNRSIAQSLVVSVRTVEGHLGRIYAKLGLSGRRALSRYVQSEPGG